MADKDSRDDSEGRSDAHGATGVPRAVDHSAWDIPTSGRPATAPPEVETRSSEPDEASTPTAPDPRLKDLQSRVTLLPDPPEPAITAAAYDLFFPPPSDTPPTYQTRGRSAQTQERRASPSDDASAAPVPLVQLNRKAELIRRLKIAGQYAGYAAIGYLGLVLVLILLFRFVNPPGSALMLFRLLTGTSIERTWVPIENISPALVRAVVVAEDGRFCEHNGIDFQAIEEAIQHANDGIPRGASTISMQVIKNMFLWNAKSYLRKVIELPLTVIMEIVWPKRRILEVYLNVAEWGPGVFGAEAAARHHFRKQAGRLSEREASLLAASLPNPVVRDAGDPGPQVSHKARVIEARMRAAGTGAVACINRAR